MIEKSEDKANEVKWRRFERLAYEIQRELAGDAVVTLNDKIPGGDSKKPRQIDISIRKQVGQYSILIVMECRDVKEPLDVNEVEGFVTKVRDVRANKGALVSNGGFTDGAIGTARHYGIDTFRLVDTESTDWKAYVTMPTLLERTFIRAFAFRITRFERVPKSILSSDPRTIRILDASGRMLGTTRDLLGRKWNNHEVPYEPGTHVVRLGESVVLEIGEERAEATIEAVVDVAREHYFGHLPINVRGFKDEQGGGIITNQFRTADIEPWRIEQGFEKGWQKVEDPSRLAVRPALHLGYSDAVPVSEERQS